MTPAVAEAKKMRWGTWASNVIDFTACAAT